MVRITKHFMALRYVIKGIIVFLETRPFVIEPKQNKKFVILTIV